jgi:hypothetical protein
MDSSTQTAQVQGAIVPQRIDYKARIHALTPELDALMPEKEEEPEVSTDFTGKELAAMHRYCLKYRDLVHGGGTPSQEQDDKFMLFQKACYAGGIAHGT